MIRSALMAALAAVVLTPSPAAAQPRMSSEPITYTLRFPAPETHYVEVEASVPAGQPSIELMMAVWTPGSYLVREYERHVEQVAAKGPDGAALAVTKTQKNRWRVEAKGAPRVTVTYKVYGREMTVRTNWIESRFALLNGAPTFLTLAERGVTRPHVVALSLPAAWKTSVTSLAPVAGEAHRYQAASYDELVDSPILAGNPTVHRFEVGGKPHVLANEGEAGVFDGKRAAADVAKIVAEHERFWGGLPYERYAFINVLNEAGGGGLEHRNSTVLMASRWATGTRRALRELADAGLARALPRLEREAAAARRAGAVRLRAREPDDQPLDRRRLHRLLRAPDGAARRADDRRRDDRRDRVGHPRSADHAGPADTAGRDGVARRVDQVLPRRREHAQQRDQLLHEGRRDRLRARCAGSARPPTARRASTT